MATVTGKIFLSYRRDDTKHPAGRVHDKLAERFGAGNVFFDVKVEPGVDFGASIEQAVAASDVLIALIGTTWTTIADAQQRPRITDPQDWVAREIAAALERGIRVVPVLVDGARMPGERDLPPSLAPLARRNAVHLRHESFDADVANLLGALDRVLGRAAAPSAPVAEPPVAPDSRRRPIHLLHHQRPDLAGREELLDAMHARLTAPGPTPRQLVLHGLGGVGKTSVMREYAHRHAAAYNFVFEVGAETPTALSTGFARLARDLGVIDESDAADPIDQVHLAFATWPEPWLLLLDNAADAAAIARAVPPAGEGRVLVTSRSAIWPDTPNLRVPALDRQAAAGFLTDRTGDPDTVTARVLADELGALPLALGQAVAYVGAAGLTLREYLALLREHRAGILRRGRPAAYDGSVATTWALAFDHLAATAPDAITLLRLLACYAADDIPVRTLLARRDRLAGFDRPGLAALAAQVEPLVQDPFAALDATAELRRYSLVSPAEPGTVSVHRLVQAVTLDQLPDGDRRAWREAAGALVETALPDEPRYREQWPAFAALLPHARAALDLAAPGTAKVADYLGASGDHMTARIVRQDIYHDALDRLGAEHPGTLRARLQFAKWSGHAGDQAGARDELAALVPALTAVLGPEDPLTLEATVAYADWTGTAGGTVRARELAAALLPVARRVLGDEHRTTLEAWHQLGFWTGQAGDPEGARQHYADFLPVLERVNGPRDADTFAARDQYARWIGESGDPAAARDLCVAIVADHEREFGPEHPDTLWARTNLAWFVGAAGDPAAARDLYRDVVPDRLRVSGPESHGTVVAQANLAYWTGMAGDPAAARDLCAAVLPVGTPCSVLITPRPSCWWRRSPAGPGRRATPPPPETGTRSCSPPASGCSAPTIRPPPAPGPTWPGGPPRPRAELTRPRSPS